jgi:hypothetical protein
VAGGGRIPGDELFSLGGKVGDGFRFWLDRLSDRGGHQQSVMIEIVFDWGERVSAAVSVSGILLGWSMESGAEWKVFLRVCDPGDSGER